MPPPKNTPEYEIWLNKLKSRVFSPEWREKLSKARKGRKFPKLSEAKKGCIPWHKGKTNVYKPEVIEKIRKARTGTKASEETKQKMSLARKGENNAFYRKTHSEETREKIRQSRLGKKASPELRKKLSIAQTGRKHTEATKQKVSEARKNWKIPYSDSKPEVMMQLALEVNGIKFEKQKLFKIGKSWHRADIFIEPNIVLEVDGVKWHIENKDMQRDLYQTQELTIMGYHVIRIRDKDILRNPLNCAETVMRLIKELKFNYLDLVNKT